MSGNIQPVKARTDQMIALVEEKLTKARHPGRRGSGLGKRFFDGPRDSDGFPIRDEGKKNAGVFRENDQVGPAGRGRLVDEG